MRTSELLDSLSDHELSVLEKFHVVGLVLQSNDGDTKNIKTT